MADSLKRWAALIFAAVVLLLYLVLVLLAFDKTGEASEQWARRLVLLGGIEALAFGAAGWLFGKEVSRQTIEQADARAEEAKASASAAAVERTAATEQAARARSDAVAAAQALKALAPAPQRDAPGGGPNPRQLADAILGRYEVAG